MVTATALRAATKELNSVERRIRSAENRIVKAKEAIKAAEAERQAILRSLNNEPEKGK